MSANANYRKLNDRSCNSSTYHKKDGTAVRAKLKQQMNDDVDACTKEELLQIKSAEDIKSVEIENEYIDDHQQCADVKINGIKMEMLWYDDLGFLQYWDESPKALKRLIKAIRHCCFVAMDDREDAAFEEVAEMHAELAKEF
jgi:hypothetical protein